MSAPNLQTLSSMSTIRHWTVIALLVMAASHPAAAWWGDGHEILTKASIQALPEQMPEFFRSAGDAIAHLSQDPDLAKNRGVPLVSDAEFPEHNFDPELLDGETYADKRFDFIAQCQVLSVRPEKVGFSPFAISEWTQRLAVAFAEHRRWPQDQVIQSKILVYAGFVAHYSQDLVQPLHATIHYDGRAGADGESPHTGIHEAVDAAVQKMALNPVQLAAQVQVEAITGDLFAAIRQQVAESNGQVDRVYELATDLRGDKGPSSKEAQAFIVARAQRATEFTASLYVTAWTLSEQLRLPGWPTR